MNTRQHLFKLGKDHCFIEIKAQYNNKAVCNDLKMLNSDDFSLWIVAGDGHVVKLRECTTSIGLECDVG